MMLQRIGSCCRWKTASAVLLSRTPTHVHSAALRGAAVRCGGLALLFTLFGANKRSAAAGCEILMSNLEDDVLNCLCQPHDPDQPYVATASLLTVSDDRVRWTNDVQTLLYCTCRADSMH